ncbi:MAG: DUF4442 domain-containing protein [Leptospiraceae bacterium]|nr:YiiD C-terminal domain-containing protein [Leptospiraceae bacterium]MCK6381113.1 DUF4442 domain-containing protein [Leptospiraceae bacterium]NUM42036.1 YiiD C-terminal domain-containing protein [Leptospiraceae bacterium]
MERPEYGVNPLWKFLSANYSLTEVFDLFAPYKGANVKITEGPYPGKSIQSSMKLIPGNTNYVGTHFGGSLYSMCDPFFMFLLMQELGENYIVWDKAASIDFVKPGKGTVSAIFYIPDEEIEKIKNEVAIKRKMDKEFFVEVKDESEQIVARVRKVLYIRKKK